MSSEVLIGYMIAYGSIVFLIGAASIAVITACKMRLATRQTWILIGLTVAFIGLAVGLLYAGQYGFKLESTT